MRGETVELEIGGRCVVDLWMLVFFKEKERDVYLGSSVDDVSRTRLDSSAAWSVLNILRYTQRSYSVVRRHLHLVSLPASVCVNLKE